jgi:hypothetical protein
MSLNEAADLLSDLPKDKAEGILKEMEQDIAEDVKETAGPSGRNGLWINTTGLSEFFALDDGSGGPAGDPEEKLRTWILCIISMSPMKRNISLGMLSLRGTAGCHSGNLYFQT